MTRHNRNLNNHFDSPAGKESDNGFYGDLLLNSEDSELFETFGEYMQGLNDLEDVKNDPLLPSAESAVKKMISDYHKNSVSHSDDEKFINDAFSGITVDKKIVDEIRNIKLEIDHKLINELTSEWVSEWHEKRQKNGGKEANSDVLRDFVTNSLEEVIIEPEIKNPKIDKETTARHLIFLYLSYSAAAILGVFILIRMLFPASDPDGIFASNYEPFKIVSAVTRSINVNENSGYSSAVVKYNLHDYQAAAIGFRNAVNSDTSAIDSRFFLGMTMMALENYTQAINELKIVAARKGDYHKEASWYLGLACLKTGETARAIKYFELLAQSPGYYSDPAEKILRRLK